GRTPEGGWFVVAGGALLRGAPGRSGAFRAHSALACGGGRQAAAPAKGRGRVPGPARRGAVEAKRPRAAGSGAGRVPRGPARVQENREIGTVKKRRDNTLHVERLGRAVLKQPPSGLH